MARRAGSDYPSKVESTPLPDGSAFRVSWHGERSVLIDRLVDGEIAWGQAFGGDNVAASVERVRADMIARPGNFLSAHRRGIYKT